MSTNTTKTSNTLKPFPGLRHFRTEESHIFFGREGQTEGILTNLSKNRFVAVIGSSGSGKSSLMYCGLIPSLGAKWNIISTTPGIKPIENLAKGIASVEGSDVKTILSTLNEGANGLVKVMENSTSKGNQTLILIDQFDELFRFRKNISEEVENQSKAFIDLLMNAIDHPKSNIHVVITLRSDFISSCAPYQTLIQKIDVSNSLISQMTQEGFKKAIEEPIKLSGAKISTELTTILLNHMEARPEQLPILQHTLMRTWDYWKENTDESDAIDVSHYEAIGKMEKALSMHADEVFDDLTDTDKEISEHIFKTLTEQGGENVGLRNPNTVATLAAIAQCDLTDVKRLLDGFRTEGRNFLLPDSNVLLEEDTVVDISHESLIYAWERLKVWIEEEGSSIQLYMRLGENAALYQEGKVGLWKPPDLQLALNWREKQQPTLSWGQRFNPAFERTMVFLETSEAEYIADEENKIRLQKQAQKRSRIVAIVLSSALVISLGIALLAYNQMQKAIEQERIAIENEKKAVEQEKIAIKEKEEADIARAEAERQKEEAVRQQQIADEQREIAEHQTTIAEQKTIEAIASEHRAKKQEKIAVEQKEIADEASERAQKLRMVSIAKAMAIKSEKLKRQKRVEEKALAAFQAYKFNDVYGGEPHDGDIYGGLYSTLKMLNGNDFNILQGHTEAVRSLTFSPDGEALYSTGSDGQIVKWDRKSNSKNPMPLLDNDYVNRSLSISKDGKFLASGNENMTIQVLDLTNNISIPVELVGHKGIVYSIAFGSGNQLVSCSEDSTVFLWNIDTKDHIVIAKSKSKVKSVDISPDGRFIAGGTEDGKIIIWDKQKDNTSSVLDEDEQAVQVVSFSHDGQHLATGDLQGTIKIWNLKTKQLEHTLGGHNARINDVKFSPDDKMLATASFDGAVQIFNTVNYNNEPIVLDDHDSWVWSMAFSPDGLTLITGGVDSQIKEWPTKASLMADQICYKLDRNMTQNEWERYVAKDIPFEKTCTTTNIKSE